MTVTLCYATPNLHKPHRGFGYLLPISLAPTENPEQALGVTFDSDHSSNMDSFTGTKISVMLGGRHWADRPLSTLPTEAEGLEMAKRLLRRHLGITEEPIGTVARLEKNAIPQYNVGHFDTLKGVHSALSAFDGRVRVAGNCYNGIGL